jgi:hypothetical protein
MSAAKKGRPLSAETRAKLSAALKGRPARPGTLSAEQLAKRRAAQLKAFAIRRGENPDVGRWCLCSKCRKTGRKVWITASAVL